jgi:ssDNA-binding Zn-finger/Zn-ribbon topoisomerase 1
MEKEMVCPKCGGPMVLRTATRGTNAGKQFYGCKNYPKCKEIVNYVSIDKETNAEQDNEGKEVGNVTRGVFECTICGKHFRTKNGLDWR